MTKQESEIGWGITHLEQVLLRGDNSFRSGVVEGR